MATKLGIYNEALQTHLDSRRIRTLTDARVERRALDAVWAEALAWMLEQGLWNNFTKADQWMPSDTAEPEFGYQFYYEKPDDYVRIVAISADENFAITLEDYTEEGDFFACDSDPLYVKYVSSAEDYGGDPGKWGPSFATAFAAELAWRGKGGIKTLTTNDVIALEKLKTRLLRNAQAKDAVNQAMSHFPAGRLVRARAGRSGIVNRQRRASNV